jgi:hypothetical protein
MMPNRPLHEGQKVAHRSLDGANGAAKVGVVTERIDDQLVIARWQDGDQEIGFVASELKPLMQVPLLSSGPVLVRPGQLFRWLRSLFARSG